MRRTLSKIHRWAGLILVIWIVLQAASGFALIFKDEIRAWSYPSVSYEMGAVSAGDIVEVHRSEDNIGALNRIIYPVKPDMPYLIRVRSDEGSLGFLYYSDDDEFVKSSSGPDWYSLLFSFHDHAFLPNGGRYIVAILGFAVLLFAGSGVYLWWPTRKKRALSIRWSGPPRLRYHDCHRVFGIVLAPILIVSAMSGLLIIFRSLILGGPVAPPAFVDIPAPYLQCEQARSGSAFLDCIEAASGEIKDIRFSAGGEGASILVYSDSVLRPGALNTISVNLGDRTVSKYTLADSVSVPTRVLDWMYPIHVGDVLGWLTKLLMPLFALAILALASFSILSWSKRPR